MRAKGIDRNAHIDQLCDAGRKAINVLRKTGLSWSGWSDSLKRSIYV
jgi:hypothetical protein